MNVMRKITFLVALLFMLSLPLGIDAKTKRSAKARNDFRKENPCPATGKTNGACTGWAIDHIKALKRGGADDKSNMQWMTTEEAKAKDRWE